MGIEPTYPAWKAGVLPLNYTRVCPKPESNQRHEDFQSSALPTELSGHLSCALGTRSEERRVGKECRYRWSAAQHKKRERRYRLCEMAVSKGIGRYSMAE